MTLLRWIRSHPLLGYFALTLATLTAYHVLMMWIYARTGSLLLAVPMHASCTGCLLVRFPATSFVQGLAWEAALWLVVTVVIGVFGRQGTRGSRQPPLGGYLTLGDA